LTIESQFLNNQTGNMRNESQKHPEFLKVVQSEWSRSDVARKVTHVLFLSAIVIGLLSIVLLFFG